MKEVNLQRTFYNSFSGAKFNKKRTHRHLLWRRWRTGPRVCFVCLNPSTADESKNDHSVSKMIGFAERMKCGALDVVNIFDVITTFPDDLYNWFGEKELSSIYNDAYLVASAQRCKYVVCAWGNHGEFRRRAANVMKLLAKNRVKMLCLKKNANGSPAHPLRLPYDLVPVKYSVEDLNHG